VEQQIREEAIELNQNTSRNHHPNRGNYRGRRQIPWHSYCSKQTTIELKKSTILKLKILEQLQAT
jgi:hypothetical protein